MGNIQEPFEFYKQSVLTTSSNDSIASFAAKTGVEIEAPGRNFKLSIVIPVFNEEENVSALAVELKRTLDRYANYEVIFIDDGSRDRTLEFIKYVCKTEQNFFFISFSRNFGHQNALRAGIEKSTGDVVITMDGDLQHPPALIHEMIQSWQSGYDVVFTTRNDCRNVSRFKKTTSSFFYSFLNNITEVDLKKGTADFRLFDKKVVAALRQFQETSIFYRGIFAWLGFKQMEIPYIPQQRQHGKSKYTLKKMISLAIDGISSFSLLPLRLASLVGLILASVSFLYVLYAGYIKFFTMEAVSGWFSVMAGIYFLGGIQLLFLGVCGEYIGKIYLETKKRPHYIISETNYQSCSFK